MESYALGEVGEPGEELLDQEPAVKDDGFLPPQLSVTLIGNVRVVDRCEAGLVAVLEHAAAPAGPPPLRR